MMKYTALKSTLHLFGRDTVAVIKKDIKYVDEGTRYIKAREFFINYWLRM